MRLEAELAAIPPEQWVTRQAIVLDWDDGPRHGICALSTPEVEFVFEMIDETHQPEAVDERIFRLSELQPGQIDRLLGLLAPLGSPINAVWCPTWRFTNADAKRQVEAWVEQVRTEARPTAMTVKSTDMLCFVGREESSIASANTHFEQIRR